jgi:IS5 family transposase
MVLQALEGLSDRDAARALRDRISWKVACGLALDDEGFDYSVLTYWRTRLRGPGRPERIFDAVRSVIDATGVIRGRSRRALDSTLLDDAVATQDTVTQLAAGAHCRDDRRWKPMVERSIAGLVARGNRRARFRGLERNQPGLSLRAAAINLRRLVNLGLTHDGAWALAAG